MPDYQHKACNPGSHNTRHQPTLIGKFITTVELYQVHLRLTNYRERFKGTKVHCNAHMTSRQIRNFCEPDSAGHRLLEVVTDKPGLSARA